MTRIFALFCTLISVVFCFAQESPSDKLEVGVDVQVFTSQPGEDRHGEQDPGLMLSLSRKVLPKLYIGLGSGLTSPYYTTTLVPVYLQTTFHPINEANFFLQSRFGQFIPLDPKLYKGGLYSEYSAGFDIRSTDGMAFRIGLGYSHQRMTAQQSDFWWGTRKLDYKFNRLVFIAGMRF